MTRSFDKAERILGDHEKSMEEEILGTAMIPRVVNFQDPLTITFRIYAVDQRFEVEIHPRGMSPKRFPIALSQHDLASLSTQISEALWNNAKYFNSNTNSSSTESESLLYQLAKIGNYAFQSIFKEQSVQDELRDLLTSTEPANIEIVSEEFVLPWPLIYPNSLKEEPVSFQNFWGMKHVVSHVPVNGNRLGASWVPPVIHIGKIPRLGLLVDDKLRGVTQKEIPFFEELELARKISLYRLQGLDPSRRADELLAFSNFWGNAYHIAHFACHAFYKQDNPSLSYLTIADDFDISHQDIVVNGVEIAGHPLVFMNACEGGNLNPLYTAAFASLILERGARGVVATECEVPDDFAAEFARKLYSFLLAGKDIGRSMLATRLYFLNEYNNPSGLVYSQYGPSSIRLLKQGD